ncbi:hypothetical protein BASA61_005610 [Batrachochytrium salamandrivorans]|nr:hypothetical protein BASA61_005610 [Batrachochytrium salamandrivorans]
MLETSLKSVAHAYGMTLDISFEQAIKDTPQFRSSMYVFADELDELEKWLDNIAKTCRLYTDSMSKINDIGLAISRRMVVNKCISLLDGTANMRTVSESMITLHGLRQKMIDGMNEGVISIIQTIISKDIRELKEARRNYEKDIEKIEMSISRYVALPKSKETSALVEDSFVLFEARKQFIKTSINYVSKIIILKYTLDSQIPDILKTCVKVHADYLEAGWDAFNGIDVVLKTLGPKLDNLRETRDETMKRLDIIRREYEERAIENARPKLKYTLENEKQVFQKSTLKTSNPAQIEREGYLFRKSSKGGSVWTRRYFTIKNTTISYCTVATTGTHKGKLMATSACSLESCDVRVAKTEDRRFCFEVQILPKTLFVLQAEHEEDMKAWITTIENSKMFPSNCSGIPATLESNNSESFETSSDDESDEGETLHQLKVQRRGCIQSKKDNTLEYSSEDDSFESGNNDIDTDDGSEKASPRLPESHSLSKIDDLIADNRVEYSEIFMTKKNHELHHHFKSIPPREDLLEVISIFLQKDIAIQGRLFITPSRLCFHSNIFGYVTLFNFKTYGKCDRVYSSIMLVWNNVRSATPLSAQDLYNQIQLLTRGQFDRDKDAQLQHQKTLDKKSFLDSTEADTQADDKRMVSDASVKKMSTFEYTLPESVQAPTGEISCGCTDHLEKKEVDVILPVTAKKLFDLLFKEKSAPIWERLDKRRGGTNRKESIWTSGPTPNREVSYILAMNNPMVKLREVDVKETDHILKQNEWITYSVELRSLTPQVPFGDCFSPAMRFCISWVSKDSCRLIVTIAVNFTKNTMMKGIIKSSGLKGLAETCADLLVILREVTGQDNETSKENMENLDEAGNVSKALGDRSTDGFKTSDTARWRSTPARDDGKFILKGVTLYTIIGITILSLLINARMWFILLPGLSGPQISDARSQFQSTERQFIPADQGKDSYLRATSQIDWATELQSASLKSISPRMREFLRLQFGVNKDTEMDKFPISLQPAKNNLLMRTLESMQFGRMHTKLVHWQRMISDTRTELVSLEKVLDGMEIHLVWSMYFNWVQDDLKSKCKGLENGQNHTSGHLCSFVVDELEIP